MMLKCLIVRKKLIVYWHSWMSIILKFIFTLGMLAGGSTCMARLPVTGHLKLQKITIIASDTHDKESAMMDWVIFVPLWNVTVKITYLQNKIPSPAHIWNYWSSKMLVRYVLSSASLRLSQFSQVSSMQYMAMCVFSSWWWREYV